MRLSWVLVSYMAEVFNGPGILAGSYATWSECDAHMRGIPRSACIISHLPVYGNICAPELGRYAPLPPCVRPENVESVDDADLY